MHLRERHAFAQETCERVCLSVVSLIDVYSETATQERGEASETCMCERDTHLHRRDANVCVSLSCVAY